MDRVQIARLQERPTTLDYIPYIFDSFMELHGDRNFRDDPAMIGGIGFLNGRAVTVIGQQRGKDTKDNIYRNFWYGASRRLSKSITFNETS